MTMIDLRWTPEARGDVYCSPACGHNCTRADYERANERAAALVARLGPGWVPRVWENWGWNHAATSACGRWKVHEHTFSDRSVWFTAFLGEKAFPGGDWSAHATTPEDAIEAVRTLARADVERQAALLDLDLVPKAGG